MQQMVQRRPVIAKASGRPTGPSLLAGRAMLMPPPQPRRRGQAQRRRALTSSAADVDRQPSPPDQTPSLQAKAPCTRMPKHLRGVVVIGLRPPSAPLALASLPGGLIRASRMLGNGTGARGLGADARSSAGAGVQVRLQGRLRAAIAPRGPAPRHRLGGLARVRSRTSDCSEGACAPETFLFDRLIGVCDNN